MKIRGFKFYCLKVIHPENDQEYYVQPIYLPEVNLIDSTQES